MVNQPLFDLKQLDDWRKTTFVWNGDIRDLKPSQLPYSMDYRVGSADIPWAYDNPKDHDPKNGGYTYPPLTIGEVIKLVPLIDLIMANDAMLFLWWPHPKLDDFVQVYLAFRELGWSAVTGITWVKVCKENITKPRYLTGHWFGSCSENGTLLRKGKFSPPPPPRNLGLIADYVFEHSRKPDCIHELLEGLGGGPYIEFFARRPPEKGSDNAHWTIVGNELKQYL